MCDLFHMGTVLSESRGIVIPKLGERDGDFQEIESNSKGRSRASPSAY
jgi:hypothetical protein